MGYRRATAGASSAWPSILVPQWNGKELWVDADGPGGPGDSWKRPLNTLASALLQVRPGVQNVIHALPRKHNASNNWQGYNETVTIPRAAAGLILIGEGARGAVGIAPTTEDATGMDIRADDVEVRNLSVAAEDNTAGNAALKVFGSRVRLYECKISSGDIQLQLGPGTLAQIAAGTHGTGSDFLAEDCEFCWGNTGILLVCTDYGAVAQARIRKCLFHNLVTDGITESVGSGGAAATTYRNLIINHCTFDDLVDGTAPTNSYVDVNANNANTGVLTRCAFPVASNGGKVLLSTAMMCTGCFFTGGISTGQPS